MNVEHIKRLQALATWAKQVTGKSANFEINFWHHKVNTEPTTEYTLWIEDIFNLKTKDSQMLIELMPYIEGLCSKPILQEVAA